MLRVFKLKTSKIYIFQFFSLVNSGNTGFISHNIQSLIMFFAILI